MLVIHPDYSLRLTSESTSDAKYQDDYLNITVLTIPPIETQIETETEIVQPSRIVVHNQKLLCVFNTLLTCGIGIMIYHASSNTVRE